MAYEPSIYDQNYDTAVGIVKNFITNFKQANEAGGALHKFRRAIDLREAQVSLRKAQKTLGAVQRSLGEAQESAQLQHAVEAASSAVVAHMGSAVPGVLPSEAECVVFQQLCQLVNVFNKGYYQNNLFFLGGRLSDLSKKVPKESAFYADVQYLLGIYFWYYYFDVKTAALHFLNAFTAKNASSVERVSSLARNTFFSIIDEYGLDQFSKDILLVSAALRGSGEAQKRVESFVTISDEDGKKSLIFKSEINSFRRYKILQGLRVFGDYSRNPTQTDMAHNPTVEGNQYSDQEYAEELQKFKHELQDDAGHYAKDPHRFKVLDKVNREILLYDKHLCSESEIRDFYNAQKDYLDQRNVSAAKLTRLKKEMLSEDWGVRYYKDMRKDMGNAAPMLVFLVTIPFYLAYYAIRATFVFGIYAAYKGLIEKKPEEQSVPKDKSEVVNVDTAPLLQESTSQEQERDQKNKVMSEAITTKAKKIETRVVKRKQAGSERYNSGPNSFWFASEAKNKKAAAQAQNIPNADAVRFVKVGAPG